MGVAFWVITVSTPVLALPLEGGELAREPDSGFAKISSQATICCRLFLN